MKRLVALTLAFWLALAPSVAGAAEYTLGPGDELLIRIEAHPDLTLPVVVQPDGFISFPLAGIFSVSGMTLTGMQEELTRRLSPVIPNLWVSVVLIKARPLRIQVIGEVRIPGHLSLPQGSTVVQALAQAGGPTEKADLESVQVVHRGGRAETLNIKAVDAGNVAGDTVLAEGDTISVPRGVIRISVIGEVERPGIYEIPRGARLLDALAAAGGPKNTAQLKRLQVYRGMGFEKPQDGGERLFEGGIGENPEMQDGYVVVVPRNRMWDVTVVTSVVAAIAAVIGLFVN